MDSSSIDLYCDAIEKAISKHRLKFPTGGPHSIWGYSVSLKTPLFGLSQIDGEIVDWMIDPNTNRKFGFAIMDTSNRTYFVLAENIEAFLYRTT